MSEKIVIAKIGAPFGVAGLAKLTSYSSDYLTLSQYKNFYIKSQADFLLVKTKIIQQKNNILLIRLNDIAIREVIANYTNQLLYISSDELQKESHEFFWHELIKLQVLDENNQVIGVIMNVISNGANDVLVISDDNTLYTIPYFYQESVLEVDLTKNTMNINTEYLIKS